ncbi:MAG: hypothetical protein WAM14_10195 [Candidatus Nitrosopolaris sp.]
MKVNSSSELIKSTHETPLNYLAFIHDAGKTQISNNGLEYSVASILTKF